MSPPAKDRRRRTCHGEAPRSRACHGAAQRSRACHGVAPRSRACHGAAQRSRTCHGAAQRSRIAARRRARYTVVGHMATGDPKAVRTRALRRERDMSIRFISKLERPPGRRLRPGPAGRGRSMNRTRRCNGRVSLMPSDATSDDHAYPSKRVVCPRISVSPDIPNVQTGDCPKRFTQMEFRCRPDAYWDCYSDPA